MIKIDKHNTEDILPLSNIQKGILYESLKDKRGNNYRIRIFIGLKGLIDFEIFKKTWQFSFEQNPQLRTVIRWKKLSNPVQIILKSIEPEIQYVDLKSRKRSYEELKDVLLSESKDNKFNIENSLFSVQLYEVDELKYLMNIESHHIIQDGWSTSVLIDEFLKNYYLIKYGKTPELKNKHVFKSYLQFIEKKNTDRSRSFWKDYLNGYSPVFLKNFANEDFNSKKSRANLVINEPLVEKMTKCAIENKVTLATLFYLAWGIVLQRLCNTSDIVFGTTLAGRPPNIKGIENSTGNFVNTIPLRIKYKDITITDYLKFLNETVLKRNEYEYDALMIIKEQSGIERGSAIFDSIVVVDNYPVNIYRKDQDLQLDYINIAEESNYNIEVEIISFDNYQINISYNDQLFESAEISLIQKRLLFVIEQMVNLSDNKISNIEVVLPDEKHLIQNVFNKRLFLSNTFESVIDYFEKQVLQTPSSYAVVVNNETVSYFKLNCLVNQFVHFLVSKGLSKGHIIGLYTDPSVSMVIGMLAILKIDCAYMPMSVKNPSLRLKQLIHESNIEYIVTMQKYESHCIDELGIKKESCFKIDLDYQDYSVLNPGIIIHPADLGYVMFTSGSTGKPKGVLIDHAGISNIIQYFIKDFDLKHGTRIGQLSEYTFDPSVEDIFAGLSSGATVYIPDYKKVVNNDSYYNFLSENEINLINFVPSVIKKVLGENRKKIKSLHTVISGGEELEVHTLMMLQKKGYTVYNTYGPTEITVECLSTKCGLNQISIGKPVKNSYCLILDKSLNLCPIGTVGEIYIGGIGLARGYINQPDLTLESFITNPYNPSEKLYKTNDLGKWQKEGFVLFSGRSDNQVKIMGCRIELGEIKHELLTINSINNATVLAIGDKGTGENKFLIAFVVPNTGIKLNTEKIIEHIATKLPHYMVPRSVYVIDKIPVTVNGKTDNHKLRELYDSYIKDKKGTIQPSTETEKNLSRIWGQILGKENIETGTSFFEQGGDSLLLMQLSNTINETFQKDIPVSSYFSHPTIRSFASYIENLDVDKQEDLIKDIEIKRTLGAKERLNVLKKQIQK